MCGARAPDTLTCMRRLAASILSLAVVALLATATVAIAQTSDDGPIQVDPPQVKTVPESSGFVDDQGNPISRAEYDRIQDAETGLQWGNIMLAVAVLALVAAGVVMLVRSRRSRRRRPSYQP